MRNKIEIKILLILFILFSFAVPAFASTYSVQDAVYDTVNYYKNNKTELSSWEEVIGLRGAGEDLSAAPWQLPDWKVNELDDTSPALDYAKTILGMLAAGQNPADAEGRNLVEELAAKQSGDGGFGGAINQTIWSIIALDTAKADYDANKAVAYLLAGQRSDGGFSLTGATGDPDPDITGFALIALASYQDINGVDAAINGAKDCLLNIQLASGGFKSGTIENTESISAVIRGLVACGEDITADKWKKNDQTMIDALLAFKLEDGSFSHIIGGNSDSIATRQALIALADLVNGNVFYNIREGTTPIPKPAENVTARVRVEGASACLADKTVTLTGTATAMDALKAAVGEENLQATGGFITRILGESGQAGVAEDTDTYWFYYVIRNGSADLSAFDLGADSFNVQNGDQIVFYIGALDSNTYASKTYLPVITVSPQSPTAGQTLTLTISAKKYVWGSGLLDLTPEETSAIGDYIVIADNNTYTGQSGQVAIPNVSAGTLTVRVENYNRLGYPNVVPAVIPLTISPGEGASGPTGETFKIKIKVTGKNREVLYSGSLNLNKNERRDPIFALQKTGLDVEVRYDGQYVYSIEGIAEDTGSTAGWKYKVNGVAPPSTSARDYELQDGDELEWFWAVDASDNGDLSPITPEIPEIPAGRQKAAQQAHEKAMEELKKMAESFATPAAQREELYEIVELTGIKAIIVGADNPMTEHEHGYTAGGYHDGC
ncbi:DUF4430 domain-containing protein [Desulfotruncus alcoholivorax]|uniref:DUF4430 domain-containing protein n=1 Tax=Desulfotruncus alcoholivorax TaxID=265477 RepID=UPI00041A35B0|nr:DUF4430 domain-containing protein [Desulfotruncus alcoholivorax]